MLIRLRREETGDPGENLRSIGENNTSNKLNSHMMSTDTIDNILMISVTYILALVIYRLFKQNNGNELISELVTADFVKSK
jgi:ABC-type uncharacterized transport system permease subunit